MAVPIAAAVLPSPGDGIAAQWPPGPVPDRMWAGEGIGPARRAVMDRVAGRRTAVIAGPAEAPVGAAFVALSGGIAMVHAMAVVAAARRRGIARRMLAAAADWAADRGGRTLALAVTEANGAARALYAGVGMVDVAGYHYRRAPAP
jgi:GNAT superfamily N-acetyltransferase